MSRQEHIIAGIRQQQKVMQSLIQRIREKEDMDDIDGYVFSVVVKQVERELKELGGLLDVSLFTDLSKQFSSN